MSADSRKSVKGRLLGAWYAVQCLADDWQAERVQPESLILRDISGHIAPDNRGRLCLFSHFDPHDHLEEYVVYYLKQLAALGAEVHFISTAEQLSDAEIARVLPYCSRVIVRRNIGLDFGSWRVGLALKQDWSRYEQVLLVNDSVYGPITPLEPIFQQMAPWDVWGITDNWDIQYHLQSYFLVFNRSAHQHTFFKRFWDQFRYLKIKNRIIQRCEVGMTQAALTAGMRVGVLCDYRKVRDYILAHDPYHRAHRALEKNRILNATHFFWDTIIQHFGCPFLKIELLKMNPHKYKDLYRWEEVIRSVSSEYEPDWVVAHLKRVMPVGYPI